MSDLTDGIAADMANIVFNTNEFAKLVTHTTPAGIETLNVKAIPLGASFDTVVADYDDSTEKRLSMMTSKADITVAEGDKITYSGVVFKIEFISASDEFNQTFDTVYKTRTKAHGKGR